jgi:uncharacterized membrane protein
MWEITSLWREELLHPLSVHFPVAFLLLATILKAFALRRPHGQIAQLGTVLLLIGVVAAWLSVWTGNLADGVVGKNLCDPTVLKSHENASLALAWLFTVAAILEAVVRLMQKAVLRYAVVLFCLAGSAILAYSAHLGASLVYEQAAGVNVPSDDCAEFE